MVLSLLRGVFLEFSKFFPSTKTNTSKFQFNLDVKCLHMMCGPHTTTLNLIYLFFFTSNVRYTVLECIPFPIYTLFALSGQSPFFHLHDFYRIWATKFTCYLQGIEQPHISHLHVLYMFCLKNLQDIYKEDTVNLFPKIYMLFTWFFKL